MDGADDQGHGGVDVGRPADPAEPLLGAQVAGQDRWQSGGARAVAGLVPRPAFPPPRPVAFVRLALLRLRDRRRLAGGRLRLAGGRRAGEGGIAADHRVETFEHLRL